MSWNPRLPPRGWAASALSWHRASSGDRVTATVSTAMSATARLVIDRLLRAWARSAGRMRCSIGGHANRGGPRWAPGWPIRPSRTRPEDHRCPWPGPPATCRHALPSISRSSFSSCSGAERGSLAFKRGSLTSRTHCICGSFRARPTTRVASWMRPHVAVDSTLRIRPWIGSARVDTSIDNAAGSRGDVTSPGFCIARASGSERFCRDRTTSCDGLRYRPLRLPA